MAAKSSSARTSNSDLGGSHTGVFLIYAGSQQWLPVFFCEWRRLWKTSFAARTTRHESGKEM